MKQTRVEVQLTADATAADIDASMSDMQTILCHRLNTSTACSLEFEGSSRRALSLHSVIPSQPRSVYTERRLQAQGYSIYFVVSIAAGSQDLLAFDVNSTDQMVSVLADTLSISLNDTNITVGTVTTEMSATITFSQQGDVDDSQSLVTALNASSITSSLADSLGVSPTSLTVSEPSIIHPHAGRSWTFLF